MRRDVGRTRMRSRDPRGAGPRGGLEIAPRYRGSGTAVWVGLGPSVRGAAARDVSTLLVRWTQRARGGRRQRRVQRPTGHAHGFRAHGVGFDWVCYNFNRCHTIRSFNCTIIYNFHTR